MPPHLHGAHARHPMPPPDPSATPGFTGPDRAPPPPDLIVRRILAWRAGPLKPSAGAVRPLLPEPSRRQRVALVACLAAMIVALLGVSAWTFLAQPRAEIAHVVRAAKAAR